MQRPFVFVRKVFRRDLASGALIAAFGIAYTLETMNIGQGASHATVPPWAFPLFVGLVLTAVGVLLCLLAVRNAGRPASGDAQSIDWRASLAGMAVLVAYAVAFVPLGFIPATVIMIPAMARIFGSRALWRDAIYAVLFAAGAYGVFNHGIGVPLPAGLLSGLI